MIRGCSIPLCTRRHEAHGWCSLHYRRWRNRGDPLLTIRSPNGTTIADRLTRYSCRATNGCLEWTGSCAEFGYGVMTVDGRPRGVHVLSWELHKGPVPPGLYVLHRCDNPPCFDHEHLFLGTQAENMADMVTKGRSLPGELNGNSRLTAGDVQEIRVLIDAGHSMRSIAPKFLVTRTTIRDIRRGRTWKGL